MTNKAHQTGTIISASIFAIWLTTDCSSPARIRTSCRSRRRSACPYLDRAFPESAALPGCFDAKCKHSNNRAALDLSRDLMANGSIRNIVHKLLSYLCFLAFFSKTCNFKLFNSPQYSSSSSNNGPQTSSG